jgi:hypothetical protein
MSAWDLFYQFWISQQTVPGNILGDILIGGATFLIGKYKVAPWLHKRHQERVAQQDAQHQEVIALQQAQHQESLAQMQAQHDQVIEQHHKFYELQQKQHAEVLAEHAKLLALSQTQHQQLLDLAQAPSSTAPPADSATANGTAPAEAPTD